MACPRSIGEFPFRAAVLSTTEMWLGLGRSFQIAGADTVDFALTVRRLTGDAEVIPGLQTAAALEQAPDAPSAAGGSWNATSGSTTHHQSDLSTTTDKMLAQAGVLVKLTGATPGWIEGTLSVQLAACARSVGVRTIEIPAALAASTPSFYLLGRVPACNADALRAAIVATDANDLEYLFFVRGVNDPDAPGSFQALSGSWTTIADGNSATCKADMSLSGVVTTSSFHQLDVMVAVRLKSGGSAPTGIVRVGAAMSYS